MERLSWFHNGLKDKTAIITGGRTGIGKEAAILFVKEGANIVISGRREEKLKEVEREIIRKLGLKTENPGRVLVISCNVSNQNDVKKLLK